MGKKNVPMDRGSRSVEGGNSSSADITNFLKAAKQTQTSGGGRLIFALDATMSRQPTWDKACHIQASMFETTAKAGGLSVQLVYFRGFGECKASRWVSNPATLSEIMSKIDCRGGRTQISKVLSHTEKETGKNRVAALVFIGDAMEESIDKLCHLAGKLGVKGVKAFMFQEGSDRETELAFREIARLTQGAFMRLGSNSAKDLEALLRAVAAYASGGYKALETHGGKSAQALLEQLKPR